jgi:PAS domain S-box-containing protein
MEMEPKPTYPLPSTEVLEGFSHAIPGVLYHFETAADGRWRFLYLSSRVEALYGVAPDAAYKDADCLTRCILAEDRIAHRSSVEAACKSLTPWAHEHRIETPSGERKWVRAQATPHPQPDGSIQWFGILTDITASRRIENALRDREAQYRRLLSNLKAGVVVHGPDTRILLSNAEANRLLGLERHEILGKAATTLEWSFVHEDGSCMRPTEYPVNRVLATHQPVRGQLVGINRPGQADRTWVMVNAFPEDDDNGVLRSVVVTFVDLTERVQIHKQLQESESLTRSILDALPESMVVLDRQGVIVQANKAWTRLAREGGADARIQSPTGIDYGAVCRGVVEPGEKSESMYAWEGICAVQRGDRPEFTHQYRCDTPTKTKWSRMRVIPLGNVPHPGVVVAHEDITERVELEAHLQALATTDDMTDLSNRRHFLAQLAAEQERLQRQVGEHSRRADAGPGSVQGRQ